MLATNGFEQSELDSPLDTLKRAGAAKGRRMTSSGSIRTDLENAGANWMDESVVVDQGLVTSRSPKDLDDCNAKLVKEVFEGVHEGQNAQGIEQHVDPGFLCVGRAGPPGSTPSVRLSDLREQVGAVISCRLTSSVTRTSRRACDSPDAIASDRHWVKYQERSHSRLL